MKIMKILCLSLCMVGALQASSRPTEEQKNKIKLLVAELLKKPESAVQLSQITNMPIPKKNGIYLRPCTPVPDQDKSENFAKISYEVKCDNLEHALWIKRILPEHELTPLIVKVIEMHYERKYLANRDVTFFDYAEDLKHFLQLLDHFGIHIGAVEKDLNFFHVE